MNAKERLLFIAYIVKIIKSMKNADPKDIEQKNNTKKKTFIVISGDGGGVKGVIPLTVLDQLSHETGIAIHELSFLNVGCSTSCLALGGLMIPEKIGSRKSKRTPKEVRKTYLENSPIIFPFKRKSWTEKQQNIIDDAGLTTKFNKLMRFIRKGHSYDVKNLEAVLDHEFGDLKASEVTRPFAFPTTSFKNNEAIWLTNQREIALKNKHAYWVPTMKMADIIAMCTRPPFYFQQDSKIITHYAPCADENGDFTKHEKEIFPTDGTFFAGSPELIAYEYAKTLLKAKGYDEDEYRIVTLSLSTGKKKINNNLDSLNGKKAKFLGMKIGALGHLDSLESTLDVALTLQYRANRDLVKEIHRRNGDLYFRFDAEIDSKNPKHPSASLTDASEGNFDKLISFAHNNIIGENREQFSEFIEIAKRVLHDQSIEDIAKRRLKDDYRPLIDTSVKLQKGIKGFINKLFGFQINKTVPSNDNKLCKNQRRNNNKGACPNCP